MLWYISRFRKRTCEVLICIVLDFVLNSIGSPILLVEKARNRRKETGDNRFHAPMEKKDSRPMMKQMEVILARPFVIMFSEPMLIALTFYISVCSIMQPFVFLAQVLAVCLWMHLPSIPGIPCGVYPRSWLWSRSFWSHVHPYPCWRNSCRSSGTFTLITSFSVLRGFLTKRSMFLSTIQDMNVRL